MSRLQFSLSLMVLLAAALSRSLSAASFSFEEDKGSVAIRYDGKLVAKYYYADKKVRRPYFAHLHEPGGLQVTRHHPPAAGDSKDHATMHPGLWLAFGDVSGEDFWRNKGLVRHVRFVQRPHAEGNRALFAVQNEFVTRAGKVICQQQCVFLWKATSAGFLLDWRAMFRTDRDEGFYFGDQEEMGLGVRVATKITEDRGGGKITSSSGKSSAKSTWGQPARWCNYSATIGDRHVGLAILDHPENTRGAWWHNRGYGLMVANAFGRKAMKQGAASKVTVPPFKNFTVRYGVLIHGAAKSKPAQIEAVWKEFAGK